MKAAMANTMFRCVVTDWQGCVVSDIQGIFPNERAAESWADSHAALHAGARVYDLFFWDAAESPGDTSEIDRQRQEYASAVGA